MTSNATLRDHNKALVLDVVLSHAPLTRNKLIKVTRLSKATVSRAVEELRADGFVIDGGVDTVIGRGRRSTYLDVPGTTGHVVGVSLGSQTTCVLVTDLRGREIDHLIVPTLDADEIEGAAHWLVTLIAETSKSAEGPVRQIVVAVPGRVQNGTEIYGRAKSRKVFTGPELHRSVEDLIDAPVLLDGDANSSLLEILREDARVENASLFILSTMVNFATCTGHEIVRGRSPAFGDLGALFSGVENELLDGLLSTSGLLRFAQRRGLDLEQIDALWLDALGQASRAEVLEAFTTAIVTAISAVAVTLDSESIYFVGRLCPLVDEVLPEVRNRLAQRLPAVPETKVVTQVLGLSIARGAAHQGLTIARGRLREAVLDARRQGPSPRQAAPAF